MSSTGARTRARRTPVSDGVAALLRIAPQLAPRIEKLAWRGVYEIASLGRRDVVATMNYGYAPADGGVEDELERHDDRFGLQLYAEVAGAADLSGKDVLEVGCGRGGGASFVFDRFKPRSLTGMDLARSAIRRARARYERPGLTFVTASADNLPFPDASFDVVYAHQVFQHLRERATALREMMRVVRPQGLIAIRDVDWGTVAYWPSDPWIDRFIEVHERAWYRNGGEPRM